MLWPSRAAALLRFLGLEDMARSYGEAELHKAVGGLDARVEMLSEDVRAVLGKLEQSITENHQILRKIDKIENKLDPLPAAVDKHGDQIEELEDFRGNLMAVVALGGIAASAIGAGFWALVMNFSGVVAFIKKLFGN